MSTLKGRVPDHAELVFIENTNTKTVHLHVRVPVWADDSEPADVVSVDGTGNLFKTLLETPYVTRCGQRTHPCIPAPNARHKVTDCFHDDQLCASCYRTLHADDQRLVFEHRQPGDSDPWKEPAAVQEGAVQ